MLVIVARRHPSYGFSQVMVATTPFLRGWLRLVPLPVEFRFGFLRDADKMRVDRVQRAAHGPSCPKVLRGTTRHTYLYFGLFCGVSTAQGGRLIGTVLMDGAGLDYYLVSNVASVLPVPRLPVLLLTFTSSRRRGSRWEGDMDAGTVKALRRRPIPTIFPESCRSASIYQFTAREREVVTEAVHGYSRDNVARKLHISPETVRAYLRRSYERAGVSFRSRSSSPR